MAKSLTRKRVSLMLLFSVILMACQVSDLLSQPQTTPPAITEAEGSGELVITISRGVRLDPASADDADSLLLSSYLYEGLVRIENGEPAPALAKSWVISEDGLDYIFNLRRNVIFHDGTLLTADLVIDNFNRWFDPASTLRGTSNSYSTWVQFFLGFKGEREGDGSPKSSVDGIEKVDNFTVLIHLNRPDPAMIFNLANPAFTIISPSALEEGGDSYGTSGERISGTGPYYLAEWTDERIVLLPYEAYWGEVPFVLVPLIFQFQ